MKRLFFGLTVDPVVGQSLLRAARRSLTSEQAEALYGEDDLHLTLSFLGSFPEERIQSLIDVADYELKWLWAPELLVGAEGDAFPSRARPRSIHALVEETADSVGRLSTIRNRTQQLGLSHGWRAQEAERMRPFQPHVTLARLGMAAGPDPDLDDFWDLGGERRWLPVDVTLYESLPRNAEGAPSGEDRYRTLAAWPLAVRPG